MMGLLNVELGGAEELNFTATEMTLTLCSNIHESWGKWQHLTSVTGLVREEHDVTRRELKSLSASLRCFTYTLQVSP